MKLQILFCIACLCAGCTHNTSLELTAITIDPSEAKEYYLDDIASDISVLSLSDSVIMGEIYDLKLYEKYILLHDYHQKKIHIFDWTGAWVNTLDKAGEGPQEYAEATLYAFNPATNELVVHSCERTLNTYKVPQLDFVSKVEDKHSYVILEWLDKDHMFGLYDYKNSMPGGGAEIISLPDREMKPLFPTDSLAIASFTNSLPANVSLIPEGGLYFTLPYTYSTVYCVDPTGAQPVLNIHFGAYALPEECWKEEILPYFQDQFFKEQHAMAPQYLILNDSICSFWYCSSDHPRMDWVRSTQSYTLNKNTGAQLNTRNILIKDQDITLVPLGTYQGSYVALVEPSLVDTSAQSESPITREMISKAKGRTSPLLVIFKLKA